MEISWPQYLTLIAVGPRYIYFFPQRHFYLFHYFASLMAKIKSQILPPGAAAVDMNNKVVVLLADDDIDDRELFEEVMAEINAGIKVQVVEDGLQLMEILNEANNALPDLIFLDLNMPRKDGKECLREIKNNDRLRNLPVVIYSTSSHSHDIRDTHGIGANLYIRKPNTFSGQVSVIKKVLSLDLEKLMAHPPLQSFVIYPDPA